MDISAGLAADLTQLTHALADPGADLTCMVAELHANLTSAISSALGMSLTVRIAGTEICVSTVGATPPATTSLAVPLWRPGDTQNGSIVIYAATPGALTDLAADLQWLFRDRDCVVLDVDLPPRRSNQGVTGLRELSVIGQACGVLITRGRSPEAARAELDDAARASDTTAEVIAERLIRGLRPAHRPFAD